ncbi:HNH endonuclease signature motif containing protein [Bacillus toyonensis]|uniref:HNH nuclease domain-containing protein n=1 Tax=Bacillus toyonensis TaxID=155322 RepID=A0ABX6G2A4_9BACI|nr:HNH endonuclease signature motif containing protein [Bacillus toyonensis]MED2706605.1 HNH endonuclease signature motif containing protein [Bacillus toyonensis]QHA15993.1 hypothetical protein GPA05_02835 [Bacillus toyonensis]
MENTREYFRSNYQLFRKALNMDECANCSSREDLQIHHIVPLSIGGTNKLTNLALVCGECHAKIHGKKSNMLRLSRIAIEKAKAKGVKFGAERQLVKEYNQAIKDYLTAGVTIQQLIQKYDWLSEATFYRRLREYKLSIGQEVKVLKKSSIKKTKLPKNYNEAIRQYLASEGTVKQVIAKFQGMSEATFYRRLREYRRLN